MLVTSHSVSNCAEAMKSCLEFFCIGVFGNPAAQGVCCEATVLPDEVVLPDAGLHQAELIQPLHVVQAQALRLQPLLICSSVTML